MANKTIYPYGTNGQLPSSIGIINDLITGGADKALSAEMGKELAQYVMIGSGTYEQAWQRANVVTTPFCWIWEETIDGETTTKPIWHIGDIMFVDSAGSVVSGAFASADPAQPTISENDGAEVAKDTQLTITPEPDSILYYSTDGGVNYTPSLIAVTLTLATSGEITIKAYCKNSHGESDVKTVNLTVSGLPVPRFEAKAGTTIGSGNVVSRGGYVVIIGASGGTLHYKVGSAAYIDVPSVGDTVPTTEVQITSATTIMAYNSVDGDDSDVVTKAYTMAALAAPTMTMSETTENLNEFPIGGGTVALSAESGSIYYTTNGDTPTSSSTLYAAPIVVSAATTIKAIAVDQYGSSGVTETSYTIVEDKIVIDTTDTTTTVNIGGVSFPLDSTEYRPSSSSYYRNVITESQLVAAGVTGKTLDLEFSDNSKVGYFYGGGFTFYSREKLFGSSTASRTTALKHCEVNVAVKQGGDSLGSYLFKYVGSENWGSTEIILSGTLGGLFQTFASQQSNYTMTVDVSGLRPLSDSGFTNVRAAFIRNVSTLIIGEYFKVASNAEYTSMMFDSSTELTTLKVMSSTPPDVSSSNVFNWLAQLMTLFPNASIKVPSGSLSTYQSASGWSDYSSKISEFS